jgi:hypothetical protein
MSMSSASQGREFLMPGIQLSGNPQAGEALVGDVVDVTLELV